MAEAPSDFASAAAACFDEAVRAGFPAFLTPVADSSPLNATPYLAHYAEFRAIARGWSGRGLLLDAMESVRVRSGRHGVAVDAILIGGSFTERANSAPKDIDCVMLYRQTRAGRAADAKALAALRIEAKRRKVDVRFLPLDADPLALIKSLCYFTLLFSKDKHAADRTDVRIVRGLLLLDCRRLGDT